MITVFVSKLIRWVRVGLARFHHGRSTKLSGASLFLDAEATQWAAVNQETLALIDAMPDIAARFVRLAATQPAERFLVVLTALVESDFNIGLALAEAQAPAADQRPTLHLVQALALELFDFVLPPESWLGADSIQMGILELVGSGPLPTRELTMDPQLWAAVTQGVPHWPGTAWLTNADPALLPAALLSNVDSLVPIVGTGKLVLVIRGAPRSGRECVATAVAKALNLKPLCVDAQQWQTCPAIAAACIAAGWMPIIAARTGAGEILTLPERRLPQVWLLGTDGSVDGMETVELEPTAPSYAERVAWWSESLGNAELAHRAAESALLNGPVIRSVANLARNHAKRTNSKLDLAHITLARRQLGADQLRLLAHPVDRVVCRDGLVLPSLVQDDVDRFVVRCQQRDRLWDGLGKTLSATPNRGARALFCGESGTGKTLACSYVATALGSPLYRVDLAAVMNKYIGESEKNIGHLLDLAAAHDAVLLFDEADSLFSRRVDGGETGERYVNMLTNFLLTRFENHPGIVVLTANNRSRIDQAFVRRLDTIIEFPLPDQPERLLLWQSHLGPRAPSMDMLQHLAAYADLPGGHIRNAVVAAAAADPGTAPIPPSMLLESLGREYRKLGRPLPPALKPNS